MRMKNLQVIKKGGRRAIDNGRKEVMKCMGGGVDLVDKNWEEVDNNCVAQRRKIKKPFEMAQMAQKSLELANRA